MGHKATSAPYNARLTAVTPKKNPWICGFGENRSEVAQQIDFLRYVTPPRVKRKALYFSIGRLHGERSGWPRRDNKRRCGLITCGITDQGLYSWSICRTASWRLQAWHHRPIWQYGLYRHTNHRTSNHRQAAAPWRYTSSSCPWYQKSEHLRS